MPSSVYFSERSTWNFYNFDSVLRIHLFEIKIFEFFSVMLHFLSGFCRNWIIEKTRLGWCPLPCIENRGSALGKLLVLKSLRVLRNNSAKMEDLRGWLVPWVGEPSCSQVTLYQYVYRELDRHNCKHKCFFSLSRISVTISDNAAPIRRHLWTRVCPFPIPYCMSNPKDPLLLNTEIFETTSALIIEQWRIQVSATGTPVPKVGGGTYYLSKFENQRNWTQRGHTSLVPP